MGEIFRLRKSANDARGIAYDNFGRRDVTDHDAACADYAVVADRHAGKNDRAASDPHIVADMNRTRGLQTLAPARRIDRMLRGVELNGRTDLHIIPDIDAGTVEKHTVIVDKDAPSKTDIVTIV